MNSTDVLMSIAAISMMAGVVAVLIYIVKLIFNKHISVRIHLYIWLVFIFRALCPFLPESDVSVFNAMPQFAMPYIQDAIDRESEPLELPKVSEPSQSATQPAQVSEAPAHYDASKPFITMPDREDVMNALFVLYLAGAAGFALYHLAAFFYLKRKAIQNSSPLSTQDAALVREIGTRLRLKRLPAVLYGESSVLIGIRKPLLLIGADIGDDYKECVITHELIHYKHRDNALKLAMLVVRCIYWFNPIIHLTSHQINRDIERLCDVESIRHSNTRKEDYAMMLFNIIKKKTKLPAVSTNMTSGGKNLLERIKFIKQYKWSKLWSAVSLVVVIAIMVTTLTNPVLAAKNNHWGHEYISKLDAITSGLRDDPLNYGYDESMTADDFLEVLFPALEALCYGMPAYEGMEYKYAKVWHSETDGYGINFYGSFGYNEDAVNLSGIPADETAPDPRLDVLANFTEENPASPLIFYYTDERGYPASFGRIDDKAVYAYSEDVMAQLEELVTSVGYVAFREGDRAGAYRTPNEEPADVYKANYIASINKRSGDAAEIKMGEKITREQAAFIMACVFEDLDLTIYDPADPMVASPRFIEGTIYENEVLAKITDPRDINKFNAYYLKKQFITSHNADSEQKSSYYVFDPYATEREVMWFNETYEKYGIDIASINYAALAEIKNQYGILALKASPLSDIYYNSDGASPAEIFNSLSMMRAANFNKGDIEFINGLYEQVNASDDDINMAHLDYLINSHFDANSQQVYVLKSDLTVEQRQRAEELLAKYATYVYEDDGFELRDPDYNIPARMTQDRFAPLVYRNFMDGRDEVEFVDCYHINMMSADDPTKPLEDPDLTKLNGYRLRSDITQADIVRASVISMHLNGTPSSLTPYAVVTPKTFPAFKDAASISPYAADAYKLLYNLNIIGGNTNNTLTPKSNLTYAQAAKMVFELCVGIESF